MIKVNFYNEKGNVSNKVRNQIRKQVFSKVANTLKDLSFEQSKRGSLVLPIATNERNETIYAEINLTITTKDPNQTNKRKSNENENETINLFGE